MGVLQGLFSVKDIGCGRVGLGGGDGFCFGGGSLFGLSTRVGYYKSQCR